MPTATTNAKCQARDDIDQGSSGALYFNTSHRSHPPGTTHRFPRGGYKLVLATAIAATLSGVVQAQQPATTTDVATARAAVLTAIPSNATTVNNYYKQNVYDPSESKIGEIVDVLVS